MNSRTVARPSVSPALFGRVLFRVTWNGRMLTVSLNKWTCTDWIWHYNFHMGDHSVWQYRRPWKHSINARVRKHIIYGFNDTFVPSVRFEFNDQFDFCSSVWSNWDYNPLPFASSSRYNSSTVKYYILRGQRVAWFFFKYQQQPRNLDGWDSTVAEIRGSFSLELEKFLLEPHQRIRVG